MTSTKRFDAIGKDDRALAGGNDANLGKSSRVGLPVQGEGLIGEPPIGSTRVSRPTQTRKVRRLHAGQSEKE